MERFSLVLTPLGEGTGPSGGSRADPWTSCWLPNNIGWMRPGIPRCGFQMVATLDNLF